MAFLRTPVGGYKYNLLSIRLQRHGRINNPIYSIIVIPIKSRHQSRFIEKLGYFNPKFQERGLVINSKRLAYWLNHGAKLHMSVKKYLIKFLNAYDS